MWDLAQLRLKIGVISLIEPLRLYFIPWWVGNVVAEDPRLVTRGIPVRIRQRFLYASDILPA